MSSEGRSVHNRMSAVNFSSRFFGSFTALMAVRLIIDKESDFVRV